MMLPPQADHAEATAVNPVPATLLDTGFRLLLLREFSGGAVPPAFALIEQHLFRAPPRSSRHGFSFALTFRAEIIADLSRCIGRPSLRAGEGPARRNPLWPQLTWRRTGRTWPDGLSTIEWQAEAHFPDAGAWHHFRAHWAERLAGRSDEALPSEPAMPQP